MAEQKHTPGPWKVVRRCIGNSSTQWPKPDSWMCYAPFVVAGSHQWQIYGDDWKHGKEHESAESDFVPANARLIAAAPDLLTACRLVYALGEAERREGSSAVWTDEFRSIFEASEAAIAKAEGR